MSQWFSGAWTTFERGGPVMWPLLALSVVTVALIIERAIYWSLTHRPGRSRWVALCAERLRAGDSAGALVLARADPTVYGRLVRSLAERPAHAALAVELTEEHRPGLDRFGAWLSTAITAAPLLGILGTVTGIIKSFELLGQTSGVSDIDSVAAGIAEALITTAFGLIIALLALFPYMMHRAHVDRAIGAIERLCAARLAALSTPGAEPRASSG